MIFDWHVGHFFFSRITFFKHSSQNICPQLVVVGLRLDCNSSRHIAQTNAVGATVLESLMHQGPLCLGEAVSSKSIISFGSSITDLASARVLLLLETLILVLLPLVLFLLLFVFLDVVIAMAVPIVSLIKQEINNSKIKFRVIIYIANIYEYIYCCNIHKYLII